ncbi:hypothetical protein BAE44_0004624 [Dichanthelium oligosanthes]|uniref:SAM domain-containing protein n=1 Tax=Dichanthelium oligosanthes TaxID=888268 RepID=A0A1E5WAT5_9POAL|nr:hypothetical protein BAE44_0004624 [Dichanthelium oligosanthes]
MYADRNSGRKRSVRDRLGSGGVLRSRSDDAKRFRRDDGTWRRELYKDSGGTQTSSGPTSRNLQSNKKSQVERRIEVVKKSSVPDLREKLSGIPSQRPQLSSTVQVDASLESLLKSLDLENGYSFFFQVDMKALVYMNEEDMKALGIPMVPQYL